MTVANYSIDWQAVVSGVSSGGTGIWVVTGPSSYVPATTSNYTASPAIHGVLLAAVVNGIAPVQFNGPVPNTVTGFDDDASGFARLNLTTGMAEFVASYSSTDIKLGPVTYGTLRIDFGGPTTQSYSPLLATELDENAADNSAALTAFLERVDSGHKGIIPVGTYYFTNTAFGLYENSFRGVTIEGEASSYDSGTGGVKFVWNGARVSGSAASLACVAKGAQDAVYTWTHFDYVRLSGVSGATASWVGRQVQIGNAARSYWNAVAVVVSVESATSVIVGMPFASTNVSVVGNTDTNNGTITWEVWHPLLELRGRDITIRGIEFLTAGGGTRKPSALIDWSQSDDSGVATHLQIDNCYFASQDAISEARTCLQTGRDILPDPDSPYYLLESGYRRPFVPYQCDYVLMAGCTFYQQERAWWSGNPTGQERANSIYACGFALLDFGCDITSRFTNAAEQADKPGSVAFDFLHCTGGAISNTFLRTANPNAQNTMTACYFEGDLLRLATCNIVGGAGFRPFLIRDCFFAPENFATDATGWIQWLNGPLTMSGTTLFPTGTLTDFKINLHSGAMAKANISDCILPSETDIGAQLFQFTGGGDGLVSIRDCMEWYVGGAAMRVIPDRDYQSGLTTEGGKYLQKVLGMSATWVPAKNAWKKLTAGGGSATVRWTFDEPEDDDDYELCGFTPVSQSGGAAAGSNAMLGYTKEAASPSTYVDIELEADPGVGENAVFMIQLVRPA